MNLPRPPDFPRLARIMPSAPQHDDCPTLSPESRQPRHEPCHVARDRDCRELDTEAAAYRDARHPSASPRAASFPWRRERARDREHPGGPVIGPRGYPRAHAPGSIRGFSLASPAARSLPASFVTGSGRHRLLEGCFQWPLLRRRNRKWGTRCEWALSRGSSGPVGEGEWSTSSYGCGVFARRGCSTWNNGVFGASHWKQKLEVPNEPAGWPDPPPPLGGGEGRGWGGATEVVPPIWDGSHAGLGFFR